MPNLQQLYLYLLINRRDKFVDGNDLSKNITDYMAKLNKFHLNICSTILLKDQISFPSDKDIQKSFEHFSNLKIISCIDYFTEAEQGQCHIYSYPFTIRNYVNITNNFPGGLFTCVTQVSLFDERPFEYEFFVQIGRSFPLMKELTIRNQKPQSGNTKTKHENLFLIQYPYLRCLHLKKTHDDYVEQFLISTKTCLPSNVRLLCDYKSLKRVTRKFTWNATRLNCGKVEYMCLERIRRFPKHFKNYFFKIDTRTL
jgi:hypothetical protein